MPGGLRVADDCHAIAEIVLGELAEGLGADHGAAGEHGLHRMNSFTDAFGVQDQVVVADGRSGGRSFGEHRVSRGERVGDQVGRVFRACGEPDQTQRFEAGSARAVARP
jgi:hypothetical protein